VMLGADMAIGDSENVYTTGNFRGSYDFDFDAGVFRLSGNEFDVYIAKYDKDGNFLWAKSFGNGNFDSATSIALDQNENVYVSGAFRGTVDFDPDPTASFLLQSPAGGGANYVTKFTKDGNFVWARSFGRQSGSAGIVSMDLDSNNNVYCAGAFRGVTDFDPSPTATFNLTSNGNEDVYILKLDTDGTFVWARSLVGSRINDNATALKIDADDNVIIGGEFFDTVDFNPSPTMINNHTATGPAGDYFVLKLDADANYIWSRTAGDHTKVTDMAIDSNNTIYISGSLSDDADVDPSSNVFELQLQGSFSSYIVKLDSDGTFETAFHVDGVGVRSAASRVAVDKDDNVYFSGSFDNSIDVNPSANVVTRTAIGNDDYFVIKLDENFEFIWGETYGFSNSSRVMVDIEFSGASSLYTLQGISNNLIGTYDFDFSDGVDDQFMNARSNVAISKWTRQTCTEQVATVNNVLVPNGTTNAALVVTATMGMPIDYTIDYDATAEGQGFVDIITSTPLQGAMYVIPGGAAAGIYNGTLTYIDTNGCEGTDNFTIEIQEKCIVKPVATVNDPVVTAGVTSASLMIMPSIGTPINYTIDYDINAENQGFLDVPTPVLILDAVYVIPGGAAAGIYNGTLTYIDADGCEGTDNFMITVEEAPDPCIVSPIATTNNPTITKGDASTELVVLATVGNPINYTIDYDLTAESQGFVDVSVATPLANAVYVIPAEAMAGEYNGVLTYIDADGCLGTDDFTITIEDGVVDIGILIYPNPTTGRVTITGIPDILIKIYDTKGSFLFEKMMVNSELDIAQLSSGLYFLDFVFEDEVYVRKLVRK